MVICMDVGWDGMFEGVFVEFYCDILCNMDVEFIVSGGVLGLLDL